MISKEHLTNAIICRENDTALEVSRILRDTQTRHLVVLDAKDAPVGIISAVDLNNRVLSEEKDPKKVKAKDIMTKNIATASIQDSYEKAFLSMARLGTYSIPIVRDGKLLGLLDFNMAFKLKKGGS